MTQTFIYNREDPWTLKGLEKHTPQAQMKSFGFQEGGNAWVEAAGLVLGKETFFESASMQILGRHNQLNALAALLAVREFGLW